MKGNTLSIVLLCLEVLVGFGCKKYEGQILLEQRPVQNGKPPPLRESSRRTTQQKGGNSQQTIGPVSTEFVGKVEIIRILDDADAVDHIVDVDANWLVVVEDMTNGRKRRFAVHSPVKLLAAGHKDAIGNTYTFLLRVPASTSDAPLETSLRVKISQ